MKGVLNHLYKPLGRKSCAQTQKYKIWSGGRTTVPLQNLSKSADRAKRVETLNRLKSQSIYSEWREPFDFPTGISGFPKWMVSRIPESDEFFLVDPESFALESGIQLKESSIRLKTGIQNSLWLVRNVESVLGIRNPRPRVQSPRMSWCSPPPPPYMVRNSSFYLPSRVDKHTSTATRSYSLDCRECFRRSVLEIPWTNRALPWIRKRKTPEPRVK